MPENPEPDRRPLATNQYRDTRPGSLGPADVGRTVRLAGWIAARRDHGGLLFIDLRDAGGTEPGGVVQLVSHPDQDAFATLSGLRVESVVSVTGEVVARSPETANPRLATGEIEVVVASVEVLSIADVLPFPVERDTEVGEDARLRYRYLDLRRGPIVERLAMRARFAQLVRSHLGERGFLEVQTPVLTASSPEGARDFLVPSRLYPGEFYALPQAPQQFKQLLMVSGVERYFQIAPCFRDESSRADRSPGEFYQIDLEMAFATQEDVFAEVELLMTRVVDELTTKRANAEWPHLSYADAVDRYGTDKPDLRFGLEIAELTTELGGRTELPMFTEAPAAGRVIRALRAQGAADRSRKWFDAYADAARKAGAIGSWLQLDPAGTKGPLAKKLTEEEIAAIVTATGAEPGDAVLTAVGPRPAAAAALGEQRSTLGRELELADPTELSFCWVVDFPMFEPDPDTGGWAFSHNPFSMPQGGLEALRSKDPGDILAFQYDLVCNGLELSSGAVRNHRPDIMETAFAIAGYGPERIRDSFPALWNAFHYGPPPHAGIAPGFDRILMLLEDQANLREVIAFPLNQTGRDLLMNAPSPVADHQLTELHLQVVPPAQTVIVVVLILALALLLAASVLALTDRSRRRSVDIVHQMRSERDERSRVAEAARDEAAAARRAAEAERDEAVARADKAEESAASSASDLQAATAGSAVVAGPTAQAGGLDALWALAVLRTDWSRRRDVGLSTAPDAGEVADPLTRVLTTEVEQLRDDAGIPGSVRVALTPAATPGEAVVVAAATSALLASLARWCDAYDLFVHRWEGRIVAVMVCEGFSGPDTVADETSELLAAVGPAWGDLDVDRDPQGRLRARLSLPVDPQAATSPG